MIDYTYIMVRQILVVLFLYMGLHMIFVRLRDEIKDTSFYNSFRMMGIAFVFVSLYCFIHTQQNRLDSQPYISIAVNLTACYSIFMIMSKALLVLLGKSMNRKIETTIYGLIAIFPIPILIGIEFGDTEIIYRVVAASYTYFVINVVLLSIYILKIHNLALINIDNIYSKDITICLNWVSKSRKMFVALIVICVLAPALFQYSRWIVFVFMSYGVFCYCHIYYGYHNMMMNITCSFVQQNNDVVKLFGAREDVIESDNLLLNYEIRNLISTGLEAWVSQKNYTQNSLTINDVAKYIGTNRTYLSKYINATYNCSFRAWITRLRIEEAKIILSTDMEIMINNVSASIGFSSTESFTHIFTRTVGQPPCQWRKARL